jgi:ferredoxin
LSEPSKDRHRASPNTVWSPAIEKGPRAEQMSYIITEPCIGTKDKSCVDVCPVDCIHGKDEDTMLFIDPEVCIDCGACVSACPVEAIYADSDVPEKWKNYIEINADYFKN